MRVETIGDAGCMICRTCNLPKPLLPERGREWFRVAVE